MGGRELERQMRDVAANSPEEVLAAYMYGSQARGEASPASDVDVGLLMRGRPDPVLRSVPREIEEAFERRIRRTVQVVVLNTAPADLVHRVLRDGVLLLDRDRNARIRFEVQSRNEYFDLEPVRRLYRRVPA